jgi:hypothetical protein
MKRLSILAASLTLLAAACSGRSADSPDVANIASSAANAPSSNSSAPTGALAYSRCMRSHGLAKFPDPGSDGAPVKETPQQLGVSTAQLTAAQGICAHLLPDTGNDQAWTPAQAQTVMNTYRNFARCVRSHGLQNWPDPKLEIDRGDAVFILPIGMDPDSPQISGTLHECRHVLHDVWGSTPYICSRVNSNDARMSCGGGSNSAPR